MPLDPQRTLFIGVPANALPARTYKFFDTVDVNEFQLIAWNAETFAADTQEKTGQSVTTPFLPSVIGPELNKKGNITNTCPSFVQLNICAIFSSYSSLSRRQVNG